MRQKEGSRLMSAVSVMVCTRGSEALASSWVAVDTDTVAEAPGVAGGPPAGGAATLGPTAAVAANPAPPSVQGRRAERGIGRRLQEMRTNKEKKNISEREFRAHESWAVRAGCRYKLLQKQHKVVTREGRTAVCFRPEVKREEARRPR